MGDTCCGVRFSQLCRAVLKLLEYSWLPSEGGGGFASDLINTLVNSFAVQTKKNMTFTLKGVQLPWKLRSFSDDRFWIKTLNGKTILRNFSGNVGDLFWWFSGKWSQYLGKRRGKRFLFDFVISWNKRDVYNYLDGFLGSRVNILAQGWDERGRIERIVSGGGEDINRNLPLPWFNIPDPPI